MTPDQRRTLGNLALAVAVVVGVSLLVGWLRGTAPTADTAGLRVEAADVPPGEVLLCEDLDSDDQDDLPVPGRAFSGEVLACPAAFDGRLVTYAGEVVGDVLRRDGGSWVLANDDAYGLVSGPLGASGEPSGTNSGLSVWLPAPQDELVRTAGRADVRGDVILVTGRVFRADPDDGGGLTIRATDVEVIAEAVAVEAPVHWRQVWAAAALGAVAVLLALRDRRLRR